MVKLRTSAFQFHQPRPISQYYKAYISKEKRIRNEVHRKKTVKESPSEMVPMKRGVTPKSTN